MRQAEQIGLSGGKLRLAIVADDLTGALDAAAPFADRGMRVVVATHPRDLAKAIPGAEVVAVSTRSRDLAPRDARSAVAGVLAALPPGVRVFKKVDSRLKGNIAAEVAAFPEGRLLVVPALPEFGRVVRSGAVCGAGVAGSIPVLPVIERDADIPDIETPEDMRRAVDGAGDALIVGARGACVTLAATMDNRPAVLPKPGLPFVMAVGSTDPITLGQVAALRDGLPGLRWIAAPDGVADGVAAPGVTLLQAVAGRGAAAAEVAAALAQSLIRLMPDAASTLLLTGGATAEAALDALGVQTLLLHGDILPGLPMVTAGKWRIITKSGGFGGPDALLRLAREAGG